jgi:hypothetical protein
VLLNFRIRRKILQLLRRVRVFWCQSVIRYCLEIKSDNWKASKELAFCAVHVELEELSRSLLDFNTKSIYTFFVSRTEPSHTDRRYFMYVSVTLHEIECYSLSFTE